MSLFDEKELFVPGKEQTIVYDLPDAEMVLYEHFFDKNESDAFYTQLLKNTQWKQDNITVYNKEHLTPRLTAWHGDTGKSYTFSGSKWEPYAWTPELLQIKERIRLRTGIRFNSVLLNLYREFGPNPPIGSVSFGETRPFQVRNKYRKELDKVEVLLKHGSFLLMSGPMQHYWEHQVPKTARQIGPRINLTFRNIL